MIKLSTLKPNPNNPRIIKDGRFKKLVASIKDFPKMMALRPMVVDENSIILGGNMRLKALHELGYKEIPDDWVKSAKELTPDEIRRFIIVDNVGFGEHDWSMLANEWDAEELTEWGLEIPNFDTDPEKKESEDLSDKVGETFEVIISCDGEREQEQIYNKLQKEGYTCRVLTL